MARVAPLAEQHQVGEQGLGELAAAGLGGVVDAGLKAMPKPPPPNSKRWTPPTVRRARYRSGVLQLTVARRPRQATLRCVVYTRGAGGRIRKARTLYKNMTTIRTHLTRRPVKITLSFIDYYDERDSKSVTVTRITR